MSRRTASWLAWSMCALSLALTALSLLLLVLNLSHPDVPIYPYWTMNTLLALGCSPVGALIVPRISPKNPIGWLFCLIGLLWAVMHFSAQYAIYTLLAMPGSLPAGEAAAWMMGLGPTCRPYCVLAFRVSGWTAAEPSLEVVRLV